jgi:hypothetical protein
MKSADPERDYTVHHSMRCINLSLLLLLLLLLLLQGLLTMTA